MFVYENFRLPDTMKGNNCATVKYLFDSENTNEK